MARQKSISDQDIHAQLLALLAESGEKALSFGALSQRCGLAPATLAQRFGSVDAMIRAALSLRDPEVVQAAQDWRAKVEAALAMRKGGGSKGREAAALIFAAWQGRQIWEAAGGKSFRLADMLKAIG